MTMLPAILTGLISLTLHGLPDLQGLQVVLDMFGANTLIQRNIHGKQKQAIS